MVKCTNYKDLGLNPDSHLQEGNFTSTGTIKQWSGTVGVFLPVSIRKGEKEKKKRH